MLRTLLPASLAAALCCGAVSALPAAAQSRSLWLYNGQSTTVYGYFLAGEGIYGSCDYDCYDLDMYLYDSAGRLVSSDTLLDSIPIVRAPYTGNYSIRVTMPNCSHSASCAVWVDSDNGF